MKIKIKNNYNKQKIKSTKNNFNMKNNDIKNNNQNKNNNINIENKNKNTYLEPSNTEGRNNTTEQRGKSKTPSLATHVKAVNWLVTWRDRTDK